MRGILRETKRLFGLHTRKYSRKKHGNKRYSGLVKMTKPRKDPDKIHKDNF